MNGNSCHQMAMGEPQVKLAIKLVLSVCWLSLFNRKTSGRLTYITKGPMCQIAVCSVPHFAMLSEISASLFHLNKSFEHSKMRVSLPCCVFYFELSTPVFPGVCVVILNYRFFVILINLQLFMWFMAMLRVVQHSMCYVPQVHNSCLLVDRLCLLHECLWLLLLLSQFITFILAVWMLGVHRSVEWLIASIHLFMLCVNGDCEIVCVGPPQANTARGRSFGCNSSASDNRTTINVLHCCCCHFSSHKTKWYLNNDSNSSWQCEVAGIKCQRWERKLGKDSGHSDSGPWALHAGTVEY